MKRYKLLTISLATAVIAATTGTGTAFAAQKDVTTTYPDNFECSLSFEGGLTDYAVYGDSYAFAYNGQLAVLTGNGKNERLPEIKPVSSIQGLDYSTEGELYVCFADGYCVYPDLETKHDLSSIGFSTEEKINVTVGGATYFLNTKNHSIMYQSKDGEISTVTVTAGDGEFSKLKAYGDYAYAVMQNDLYRFEGSIAVKVEPTYFGYIDKTSAIPTGTASQSLKSYSEITCGWLEKNKYYTEVNLDNALGETFEIPTPQTATKLSQDRLYCMILAESGNAYLLTMGGKCYLTAKTSVSLESESPALTPTTFTAAYAIENTGIYSRPYLSQATLLYQLAPGSSNAVSVLGEYTDFVGTTYYKVKLTQYDGSVITGYTAKAFMTEYSFPAEDEELHPDGGDTQPNYQTNVVTVVLAVAIVALVIVAILYLAAASAKKNKKDKRKQNRKREQSKRRSKRDDYYDDRQRRRRRRYDDYYDDEDYDDYYDDEDYD